MSRETTGLSRFVLLLAAAGCGAAEPNVARPAPAASAAPAVKVVATDAAAPSIAAGSSVATGSSVAAGSTAAGPAPSPTNVDLSLSAPDSAQIVANAADGRTLLSIGAWVEGAPSPKMVAVFGSTGIVRSSTRYLAILDARHDCLEETVRTDTLDAAGSTGTIPEALAILQTEAAKVELSHLWRIARRFGVRVLGQAAFGIDDSFVVVEANNRLYFRSDAGTFAQLPVGASTRLTPSPDGAHIAFAQCGAPCGGAYGPAILDTQTRKVRRLPIGNAHDFHWSKDGKALYFSYDDRPSGLTDATKVCIGRVEGDAARATTVRCFPSSVLSQNISAASPSAGLIALQVRRPRDALRRRGVPRERRSDLPGPRRPRTPRVGRQPHAGVPLPRARRLGVGRGELPGCAERRVPRRRLSPRHAERSPDARAGADPKARRAPLRFVRDEAAEEVNLQAKMPLPSVCPADRTEEPEFARSAVFEGQTKEAQERTLLLEDQK
jgi:hypothetical protein